MPYYRADKRLFSVGERITTAAEYYDKFRDTAKVVEDMLEQYRPATKPQRVGCLFVFEDEQSARKHWSKMSGGKLYRVSIDEAAILHKGDMALMDEMKSLAEAGTDLRVLAEGYWFGSLSPKPEIEVMVSCAIVEQVISTSDTERQNYLRARLGLPPLI